VQFTEIIFVQITILGQFFLSYIYCTFIFSHSLPLIVFVQNEEEIKNLAQKVSQNRCQNIITHNLLVSYLHKIVYLYIL
jgi:hypothetical protein